MLAWIGRDGWRAAPRQDGVGSIGWLGGCVRRNGRQRKPNPSLANSRQSSGGEGKVGMAASRASAVQAFESRFPIVAANLRALVSSWLPPARDPSPVDSHSTHKEEPSAGRIER